MPDPDLEIRGWGAGGPGLQKNFFGPFGPQFGLIIRRRSAPRHPPPPHPLDPPLNSTVYLCHLPDRPV